MHRVDSQLSSKTAKKRHVPILLIVAFLASFQIFTVPCETCAGQAGPESVSSPAHAAWEIELFPDATERQRLVEMIAQKERALSAKSITLNTVPGDKGAISYVLNGTGTEDMRRLLSGNALDGSGIIGGPFGIKMTGKVAKDQIVTIVLDANPSTGYTWEVARSDGAKFAEQGAHTFEARNGLPGGPARQRIVLKALQGGDATVKLAYRRPFDPDEKAVAHATLDMAELPETVDLSDPAPSVASSAAPQRSSASAALPPPAPPGALPGYFDWRERGGNIKIKDQKACGSCWAFATAGILESSLKINYGFEFDVSEQFLVSCNVEDPKYSCNGGYWAHDYHLVATNGWAMRGDLQTIYGAVLEKDMPYKASDIACKTIDRHSLWMGEWGWAGSKEVPLDVDQIKTLIYNYGPVAVTICDGPAFQAYKSGVFDTDESALCPSSNNHAVILVGWDDVRETWMLKNSWGTKWGQKGYMDIKWWISNIGWSVSFLTDPYINCTYKLTPDARTISSKGGNITVGVSTAMLCPPPEIEPDDPWVTVVSQTWNNQKGSVKLNVQASGTSLTRTSGVKIGTNATDGGTTFAVKQSGAPCKITGLSPASYSFDNMGGAGTFDVKVSVADCEWVAANFLYWTPVQQSGVGNQTVNYTVSPNESGGSRTGKITVTLGQNGKKTDFTVKQSK